MISVKVNKLNNDKSNIVGLASVHFDEEFAVTGIMVKEGSRGLFVDMPKYKSSKVDANGNPEYKEYCHPIESNFAKYFYKAIIDAYKERKTIELNDNMFESINPSFNVYETGNILGIGNINFSDKFVVNNVRLVKSEKGESFLAMPSRKGKDKDGNEEYKDLCYPLTADFRKGLTETYKGMYESQKKDPEIEDVPSKPQKPDKKKPKKAPTK